MTDSMTFTENFTIEAAAKKSSHPTALERNILVCNRTRI